MTMPPHDRVPPPPHEAHGPGMCLDCGQVVTMHYTGRCRRCGDWCTSIPAHELVAGDWFFDGMGWTQAQAVARYEDRVVVSTEWHRPTSVRPSAAVWVAAHQRPRVGVLA